MKKTKEECEREPEGHEYAMIYNDGTTCMNCGHHRGFGEESGTIRSVSGVVVPSLLCDLARALPKKCDPSHEPRENPAICKPCDESRDELQQMVGDGDLNAIAVVVGVYLRRLYAEHELVCGALRDYISTPINANEVETWKRVYVLEDVFAEVLSDEERGIPSDDEAVRMVKEMIEEVSND